MHKCIVTFQNDYICKYKYLCVSECVECIEVVSELCHCNKLHASQLQAANSFIPTLMAKRKLFLNIVPK